MVDFRSSALVIGKATALLLFTFLCAAIAWVVFWFAVSSDYRDKVLATVRGSAPTDATSLSPDLLQIPGLDVGSVEYMDMQQFQVKHWSIVDWVLSCNKVRASEVLPEERSLYPSYYFGPATFQAAGETQKGNAANQNFSQQTHVPDNVQRSLMLLSQDLWGQRYSLYVKSQSAYRFWQISTFVTIGLGMLTTILGSLNSTPLGEGQSNSARAIRVLAIVFPAIGTACAAVVAFYGPQAVWNQTSFALGGLGQLHNQMAATVWEYECKDGAVRADVMKELKNSLQRWNSRYAEIQTVSNPVGQSGSGGGDKLPPQKKD